MFDILRNFFRPTPEQLVAREERKAAKKARRAEIEQWRQQNHPPGVWKDSVSDEAIQNMLDY